MHTKGFKVKIIKDEVDKKSGRRNVFSELVLDSIKERKLKDGCKTIVIRRESHVNTDKESSSPMNKQLSLFMETFDENNDAHLELRDFVYQIYDDIPILEFTINCTGKLKDDRLFSGYIVIEHPLVQIDNQYCIQFYKIHVYKNGKMRINVLENLKHKVHFEDV